MVWVQNLSLNVALGVNQDFQKEGKNGKKDQAEQTYAQLDQIQDWQQNQVQRQEKTLEKNKAEVLSKVWGTIVICTFSAYASFKGSC